MRQNFVVDFGSPMAKARELNSGASQGSPISRRGRRDMLERTSQSIEKNAGDDADYENPIMTASKLQPSQRTFD